MDMAKKVMGYLDIDNIPTADDHISSYRNTMHSCFNLGFEVRDPSSFPFLLPLPPPPPPPLILQTINYFILYLVFRSSMLLLLLLLLFTVCA